METVRALRGTGHRGGLIEVTLASGEAIRLHERRVPQFALASGCRLDVPTQAALRRAAITDRAEQRALRLIAVRARARGELDRRLASWGLDTLQRGEVIERLARLGLLDDARLAEAVSGSLRGRGHGHLRAQLELDRLDVEAATGRAVVAAHAAGDRAAAANLVQRRFGEPPYPAAQLRRAAGLLERRGFDHDTIADVLGIESGA